MAGRLEGKVALITGAANGCGLAAARLFAREGARVGIVDLPGPRGEAAAAELTAGGQEAVFAPADVSVAAEVEAAVATVTGRFGPITILMNHAGILAAGPFLETEEAEWDRVMAINLFYTTLEDPDAANALIQVPNSLFFQKSVRRWR